MVRLGAVNIDTSHPLGFAEVLAKSGRARYVAVYNDSFRGDDEVDGFVRRFGLEKRCASLEELADACDLGMIQGCNWDDHIRCAQPFWDRGKPVFLDKPLVGNLADCRRLEALVREGAVILGSSSARYAREIRDFLAIPQEERGRIVHVTASGGVDEFNYGIHVAEALGGLLGQGAQSVRYAGRGEIPGGGYADSFFTRFSSGVSTVHTLYTGAWQPFAITVITDKKTVQLTLDASALYAALLEEICDYMEGKPNRLALVEALTESVRIMLAGKASRERGGEVRLDSLPEDDPGFDGAAFWREYGAAAGKIYL